MQSSHPPQCNVVFASMPAGLKLTASLLYTFPLLAGHQGRMCIESSSTGRSRKDDRGTEGCVTLWALAGTSSGGTSCVTRPNDFTEPISSTRTSSSKELERLRRIADARLACPLDVLRPCTANHCWQPRQVACTPVQQQRITGDQCAMHWQASHEQALLHCTHRPKACRVHTINHRPRQPLTFG
jgi:hypothetical protein